MAHPTTRFVLPDTEEACAAYLVARRWPDGFRCPLCGSRGGRLEGRRALRAVPTFQCRNPDCRCETALTAGTALQGTHLPLATWVRAVAYLVARGHDTPTGSLPAQRGPLHLPHEW